MRDIPTASFLMWSLMVSHTRRMNWWGTTKIRMSAPFTDSAKSGTATWRRKGVKTRSVETQNKYIKQLPCERTQNADRFVLTTFGGSLWPGRYLTFSWSVLMISVSLRPSTVSSNTHMLTVVSNLSYLAALAPTILAMAEPLWRQRSTFEVTTLQLLELVLCQWALFVLV